MVSEPLHITYQRLLSRNSFGSALYFPVDASKIAPGHLGYFNDNGHWHSTDIDIKSVGTPLYSDLSAEDTSSYECGVIKSSNIVGIEFDVGVSVEYTPSPR